MRWMRLDVVFSLLTTEMLLIVLVPAPELATGWHYEDNDDPNWLADWYGLVYHPDSFEENWAQE
ncbi:MAG: hypothetical protein QW379_09135 [Thermoplasmata archaeon]